MYLIGEFSRIGSVTTKTLRYYDKIGLLHPARISVHILSWVRLMRQF